jgi:hypothetical protein
VKEEKREVDYWMIVEYVFPKMAPPTCIRYLGIEESEIQYLHLARDRDNLAGMSRKGENAVICFILISAPESAQLTK